MDLDAAGNIITYLDAGAPLVVLAGVHLGCYQLFGTERVRAIRDLKGKTVPIDGFGGPQHVLLSSMAAYVGLNPSKDINWVVHSSEESMNLLAEGKVDAFMAFPPEPQELKAKKVGHVIVDTATGKPWSQYFCCMLNVNREFMQKHPVATKRAARAILKAADPCAQPERAARIMVEGLRGSLRLCPGDPEGGAVQRLAHVRSGEHDPLPRAAPARCGNDQVHAAEAHRAGDGLAVFERAEEGTESVTDVIQRIGQRLRTWGGVRLTGFTRPARVPRELPSNVVPRFSAVAFCSVLLLIGTGIGQSLLELPTLASLWQTSYGQALLWKIGLLSAALALAGVNLARTKPRLQAGDPSAPLLLRRLVQGEIVFVAAALFAAAVLSSLAPPSSALAKIQDIAARAGPGPVLQPCRSRRTRCTSG
jgi:hypothetical protein